MKKQTEMITFRCDGDMKLAVGMLAEKRGVSVNQFLANVLADEFGREVLAVAAVEREESASVPKVLAGVLLANGDSVRLEIPWEEGVLALEMGESATAAEGPAKEEGPLGWEVVEVSDEITPAFLLNEAERAGRTGRTGRTATMWCPKDDCIEIISATRACPIHAMLMEPPWVELADDLEARTGEFR